MNEKYLDEISENALLLFPLLKRLFAGDSSDPALASLRNQTYHILRILELQGPLPVSRIGKQLFIAKQNMTTAIDKLVKDGLVERNHDDVDRRVVNVSVTEKGKDFLKEKRQGLKNIVEKNLSKLSHEEMESFRSIFSIVRNIVQKLE